VRPVVVLARTAAFFVAIWALAARSDCAFVTETCLGTNVFSYFTIHSAFLLVLALLLATMHTASRVPEPAWLTVFRGLATTYTVVSGVVFGTLLVNAELFNHMFLVPLSSKVLHFVLPVYAVLDLLLAPGRNRLRWRTAGISLVFPALWAVYTMVRGELVGWYPYVFLDPAVVGGYGTVAVYALALSAFILLVAVLVVAATRLPTLPGSGRGHRRDGAGEAREGDGEPRADRTRVPVGSVDGRSRT
jgi:hypothetical protein